MLKRRLTFRDIYELYVEAERTRTLPQWCKLALEWIEVISFELETLREEVAELRKANAVENGTGVLPGNDVRNDPDGNTGNQPPPARDSS